MTEPDAASVPEDPALETGASMPPGEPIAIVGIGCRFPGGADGPLAFWRLLRDGVDAITEVPADRWSEELYYNPDPTVAGTTYSKWGGWLEGLDRFEPERFRISPREAALMDPQQRLALEVTYEAFEDAGLPLPRVAGRRVGVYLGISTWDYALLQFNAHSHAGVDPHTATGSAFSILANRVSYSFDLKGPSMSVDTACSSSLVAVHLACRSLWSGESRLAVAGGVNVALIPGNFVAFSRMGMLSPDGRCKAFDAGANGFVRGEGAGAVILKPESAARRDGDRIYALILNTGVNQDGRTTGLVVPNGKAQVALLEQTYRSAGLSPGDLAFVEAHGTGTAVGDPIEANAIGAVYAGAANGGRRCAVGSVKTNIGHLEAAAGIAGLVKAALALHHRRLPASLHFERPNPEIDFEALRLAVPPTLSPLESNGAPILAGVNSFGFGGTNAHTVLSSADGEPSAVPGVAAVAAPPGLDTGAPLLLPISAHSPDKLRRLAESWAELLEDPETPPLVDLAATAALRREHHRDRLCLEGRDR